MVDVLNDDFFANWLITQRWLAATVFTLWVLTQNLPPTYRTATARRCDHDSWSHSINVWLPPHCIQAGVAVWLAGDSTNPCFGDGGETVDLSCLLLFCLFCFALLFFFVCLFFVCFCFLFFVFSFCFLVICLFVCCLFVLLAYLFVLCLFVFLSFHTHSSPLGHVHCNIHYAAIDCRRTNSRALEKPFVFFRFDKKIKEEGERGSWTRRTRTRRRTEQQQQQQQQQQHQETEIRNSHDILTHFSNISRNWIFWRAKNWSDCRSPDNRRPGVQGAAFCNNEWLVHTTWHTQHTHTHAEFVQASGVARSAPCYSHWRQRRLHVPNLTHPGHWPCPGCAAGCGSGNVHRYVVVFVAVYKGFICSYCFYLKSLSSSSSSSSSSA